MGELGTMRRVRDVTPSSGACLARISAAQVMSAFSFKKEPVRAVPHRMQKTDNANALNPA